MGTAGGHHSQPEAPWAERPVSAEGRLPAASTHPGTRNFILLLAKEGPGASQAVSSLPCQGWLWSSHRDKAPQHWGAEGNGTQGRGPLAALAISCGPGQGHTAQTGAELCQGLAPHRINAIVPSLACVRTLNGFLGIKSLCTLQSKLHCY